MITDYKKLIDLILSGNKSIDYEVIHNHPNTKVYLVRDSSPLIIRVANGHEEKCRFDADLLDAIDNNDDLTAKILYFESRVIDGERKLVQVQTYLPGKSLDYYPNDNEIKSIIDGTYKLHNRLCKASDKFRSLGIPTIGEVIKHMVNEANDCELRDHGIKLLGNSRFQQICKEENTYLTHFDLWPENVKIEHKKNKCHVRFIDLDPVLYGQKLFQPAILFSSYFLLGSQLFGSEEKFHLDSLLSAWPKKLDRYDVLLLMLIFPIGIGLSKEKQFKSQENYDNEAYIQSIKPLLYCINYIWDEIDSI